MAAQRAFHPIISVYFIISFLLLIEGSERCGCEGEHTHAEKTACDLAVMFKLLTINKMPF